MRCISLLTGLFLFLTTMVIAQPSSESVCKENYCSYGGGDLLNIRTIYPFTSEEEARAVMTSIVKVMGLVPNFVIQSANVPNAAAWINESQRYILYNPTWIQSVKANTHSDWSAISILAHEIGHHLNGHTLSREGSRPATELEADEFSGFVLRKMGATLDEAQLAMRHLASPGGSATHPPRHERLTAIATGWYRADQLIAGEVPGNPVVYDTGMGGTPLPVASSPPPAFAEWRVSMVSNPESQYYITKNKTFVLVKNGKVYNLGEFKNTDSSEFPFIIILEDSPNLIISQKGELISQKGSSVGYLIRE